MWFKYIWIAMLVLLYIAWTVRSIYGFICDFTAWRNGCWRNFFDYIDEHSWWHVWCIVHIIVAFVCSFYYFCAMEF